MKEFIRQGLLSIPEMLFWWAVCVILFPLAVAASLADWIKKHYI